MRYFPLKFHKESLVLLDKVKGIFNEMADLCPLTVRQIFYQVISQPDSPLENSKGSYHKLGRLLVKARLCGEIPFDQIEDRTRYTSNRPIPLDEIFLHYYPEAWANQSCYIEVFVEKEGLRSFFVRTLRPYYVPVTPIRGFDSLSDVMESAERICQYRDRPRHILVFSDFDPSGEAIFEDFEFRLKQCLIMRGEDPTYYDGEKKKTDLPYLCVEKVALTSKQVEQYCLPPKFVKIEDPRSASFTKKYGKNVVVELDAVPPRLLQEIVLDPILPHMDLKEVERLRKIEQRIKTDGLERLRSLEDSESDESIVVDG